MGRGFSLKSRVDLTEGPIFKNLLLFALPILLGTIVTQLYNVADSVRRMRWRRCRRRRR